MAVAPSTVISVAALTPKRMVLPADPALAKSAFTVMVFEEPAGTVNKPAELEKVITLSEVIEIISANLVLPSYKYTLEISEFVETPDLTNLMPVTLAAVVPAVKTNFVNGAKAWAPSAVSVITEAAAGVSVANITETPPPTGVGVVVPVGVVPVVQYKAFNLALVDGPTKPYPVVAGVPLETIPFAA